MMWLLSVLFACAAPAMAHDVPNDVRIQAFFKPSGKTLQLLVRVPLAAMQEVDFPRRGPGYLDIARADEALITSAKLWIADSIEIYEGDKRLPYPRIVAARVSLPSDRSFAGYETALAHFGDPRLAAIQKFERGFDRLAHGAAGGRDRGTVFPGGGDRGFELC